MKYGRHLLAAAVLVFAGTAHGATVYKLDSITLNTGNSGGGLVDYPFGSGPLAAAQCFSCGIDTVTDDDFGNLTVSQISYRLAGFGADFTNTFSGTATLGTSSSLLKAPGESCVVNAPNTAVQYCSATDNRSYAGDWLSGLLADGVTASNSANLSAVVTGSNLVISVKKALTTTDAVGTKSWLRLNFNYSVVPVPAAVWLFGSALGILGLARRRAASV
jgi:hypothetical protein